MTFLRENDDGLQWFDSTTAVMPAKAAAPLPELRNLQIDRWPLIVINKRGLNAEARGKVMGNISSFVIDRAESL